MTGQRMPRRTESRGDTQLPAQCSEVWLRNIPVQLSAPYGKAYDQRANIEVHRCSSPAHLECREREKNVRVLRKESAGHWEGLYRPRGGRRAVFGGQDRHTGIRIGCMEENKRPTALQCKSAVFLPTPQSTLCEVCEDVCVAAEEAFHQRRTPSSSTHSYLHSTRSSKRQLLVFALV